MLFHNLDDNLTVSLPGGDLLVTWPKLEGSVFLKGPATFVYEGRLM
jgi:diaminopimelate epimerase